MRVLITGANGFVGRAIASELSSISSELLLLDRPGFSVETVEAPRGARAIGVDITNPKDLERLEIADVDVFIHAAGIAHQFGPVTKELFWKVNVEGTESSANMAARLNARHFILISSVSVYGTAAQGTKLRTEDTPCAPVGFYAESKLESEIVAKKICEQNGMALTILRLATVIGEGDAGNVSRLIRSIDRNRFLWIGSGENNKSLVYKQDVARACAVAAAEKTRGAEIFNVSAKPVAMRSIVNAIEGALGKKAFSMSIPPGLLRAAFKINSTTLKLNKVTRLGDTVEKWLSDETFSSDKIKEVYGFSAGTSMEEAIRREVEWYLKNK